MLSSPSLTGFKRLGLFSLHALLLAAPTAHASPEPAAGFPAEARVRTLLEQRIADGRAKGLAVALVAASGEVIHINAGDSGNPARPRIESDTIFEIGSITKTFTGTLLAQMSVEGLVRPSDTVRDLAPTGVKLPPGSAGDINLLQLATHTSGLPRLPMSWAMFRSFLQAPDNPYANYTAANMWDYLASHRHEKDRTFKPAYSNLGMGLLGDLLATRAKSSYGDLVATRITRPLGMPDTGLDTPTAAQARLAVGYNKKLKPTSYWSLPAMAGAGALRSTPRDMVVYLKSQQSGSLAGARLTQEPRANFSDGDRVGYAWLITAAKGDEIVWHNGGTGGFRSFMGFSRKSGKGVVVLGNSEHGVDDLALHLLNPAFALTAKQ